MRVHQDPALSDGQFQVVTFSFPPLPLFIERAANVDDYVGALEVSGIAGLAFSRRMRSREATKAHSHIGHEVIEYGHIMAGFFRSGL